MPLFMQGHFFCLGIVLRFGSGARLERGAGSHRPGYPQGARKVISYLADGRSKAAVARTSWPRLTRCNNATPIKKSQRTTLETAPLPLRQKLS